MKKIYDSQGFSVGSIVYKEFETPFSGAPSAWINSKSLDSLPEYESEMVVCEYRIPTVMSENNLILVTIAKPGVKKVKNSSMVVQRKIIPKHEFKNNKKENIIFTPQIPPVVNIVVDKLNKRIKLVGKKTVSEWIEVERIPEHKNKGNNYGFNHYLKEKLKKEIPA